jgi:hAT family C-terminal dimerisation region
LTRYYKNQATAIPEDEDDDIFIKKTNVEPMELRTYCDSRLHSMSGKFSNDKAKVVLTWWKAHQGIYPNLSRMARDYLAIPLFSSGKILITDNRNCLNEDTIQAHECLKSWIK